jgi:MFS-type transporter involved in bile tolerance (Atg22 family)
VRVYVGMGVVCLFVCLFLFCFVSIAPRCRRYLLQYICHVICYMFYMLYVIYNVMLCRHARQKQFDRPSNLRVGFPELIPRRHQ